MSGSTVLLLHIWHLFTYPCSVWSMHVSWCMCGSERQLSGPVLIPSCDSRVPTKAVSIGSECPYSLSHPSQHPFTPPPRPNEFVLFVETGSLYEVLAVPLVSASRTLILRCASPHLAPPCALYLLHSDNF